MDEASSSPSIQNINNLPAGDTNSCLCLLLSLQWTAATDDDHDDPTGFSKAVQDVWRWKDAVLGDGRDFFVPKPKTLRALQSAIQQQNDCITECVVLSNCARFEILLVVTAASNQPQANENDNNDNNNNIHDLLNSISSFILFQVRCYQRQQQQQQWNRNLSPFLLLPMDNPQLIFPFQMTFSNTKIDHSSSSVSTDDDNDDKNVKDLSRHWSIRTNVQEIVEHMCEVAAGMAERPRRPGRTVPFRPFSSRDAHILLQLKRTFDVTNNNQQQQQQQHDQTKNQKKPNTETTTTTSIILPKLLQTAIRAGRAARNPKIVPELVQLRQTYGTGDSKYDIEPPMEVSQRVAEASVNNKQSFVSIGFYSHHPSFFSFCRLPNARPLIPSFRNSWKIGWLGNFRWLLPPFAIVPKHLP
jgi:hypothetical protein